MPTYVVRSTHPPDQCPTANSKVREVVQKAAPEMPGLAQGLGVRIVAGPRLLIRDAPLPNREAAASPLSWSRPRVRGRLPIPPP